MTNILVLGSGMNLMDISSKEWWQEALDVREKWVWLRRGRVIMCMYVYVCTIGMCRRSQEQTRKPGPHKYSAGMSLNTDGYASK